MDAAHVSCFQNFNSDENSFYSRKSKKMKTKITKELVDSLSSDTIAKKEYDKIIKSIEKKVEEIWLFICKEAYMDCEWYAFRNDRELGHGDGSTGGCFNPRADKQFIEILGEKKDVDYCPYNEGFPTNLLWAENWKEIVIKEIEKAEKKQITDSSKKEIIQKKIKSKLTKEELKHIQFK